MTIPMEHRCGVAESPLAAESQARAGTAPMQPVITSRRVQLMVLTYSQICQHRVPGLPVRPSQQPGSFRITDYFLALSVPPDFASQAKGEIGQVANRGRAVATL